MENSENKFDIWKDFFASKYWRSAFVFVGFAFFFATFFSIMFRIIYGALTPNMAFGSVVLAFIGVLATFVVVNNLAQVAEMDRRFKERTDDLEKRVLKAEKRIVVALEALKNLTIKTDSKI